MKKVILILVAAALAFGGVTLFKRAQQAKQATPMPQPPAWRVWTVEPGQRAVMQSATFLAKLESKTSASLASKLSGQISELAVRESQPVKQGELLLRIDDSEIRASIDGLRATLASARGQRDYSKKQLERMRKLFKVNSVSRDSLESAEAAYNSAAAQVRELQQKIRGLENQLNYSRITAPFDGVVGSIYQRAGDLAVPGKPILSINSLPQKLTFSFVPGAADIKPGQPVLIDGKVLGKLATLYSDARAGLWVAEVALDEHIEQPVGSYLNIGVVTRSGNGCSVPLRALLNREQSQSVMRYDGERFIEQQVEVLAQDADYALIAPCIGAPVAIAAEAKLALLPTAGRNVLIRSDRHE
jgi:RND family efflux transporter MFP subunit